jgi:hypothetical protein
VAAVGRAHTVALTSYTLGRGPVLDALVAAAARGASVSVRLEGAPVDDPRGALKRVNAAAVAALRAGGAAAGLTHPGEPALHMKAAVVDGVAWLDDRNWAGTGPERLLRDTGRAAVAATAAAVTGGRADGGGLATTKSAALRLEARVIAGAGPGLLRVESESFGNGPIYSALLRRAKAGRPTELIVAGREAGATRERAALRRLAGLGVAVRVGNPHRGDLNEKLALGGGAAWCGSANATFTFGAAGEQRDWGLTTRAAPIVDGLRRTFEANWTAARPPASRA